jgi:hypothetical protein
MRPLPALKVHLLLACALAAPAACGESVAPAHTEAVAGDTLTSSGPDTALGITRGNVRAHIFTLAADSMGGRGTPGAQLDAAAAYITRQLQRLSLEPLFDGSFTGSFPCSAVEEANWPVNVGAFRRGSDPRLAREWIVVSAHYDGLGLRNGQVMNGANDDISGTAAVLEVARAFAAQPAPARSIAFVAFAGEETWLTGSKWFVTHLPARMDTIVADVNLEMLGRTYLMAVGHDLSSLGENAVSAVARHPELNLNLYPNNEHFGSSDNWNFFVLQVPALTIGGAADNTYHTANDDPETVNIDQVTRAARLTFYLVRDVANGATAPALTAAGAALARAAVFPGHGCHG